ncbi:hypothetical protein ACVK1X_005616 [Pseudomonas sp. PvR086]|jgi:hypothetical protein|uniref:Uncharacterized protein n=1 Tax=Pseudomonas umsongensis TaxID=198618 RepID=A0ACC5MAN0_9PSED|nr:hypothetical protein PGR6_32260 [Pseudomonas sp. GR 6-02]EJM17760.1 hypothetical protein PMI21_02469 [Pseudomonas sp. GM18]MBB2885774.1 hypothetical protein [Pseudomonas umsongensis]MCP1445871.1 hypothetical protein [Pseudomonas sp. GGS8]MDR7108853.1 hypothetical protein [Pseudomonas frederiksbergensis]NMN79814.1 hypothetical protein [Pseudomonas sp. KD5]PZW64110.1 hypothetical protein F475_01354 [Pseudomonas sp. URMO17WK12:I6]CAH0152574.1 hypothetical protein SRABI123_00748 [Pseudomonas 
MSVKKLFSKRHEHSRSFRAVLAKGFSSGEKPNANPHQLPVLQA